MRRVNLNIDAEDRILERGQRARRNDERRTIAVLVDNEPGVLARVIGLFSGRGYNIDSLTVAEVDDARRAVAHHRRDLRHAEMVIEQIKAQLDRLVPVHRVSDLTDGGPACRARTGADQGRGHAARSASRRCASPTSSAPAWSMPRPSTSSSR